MIDDYKHKGLRKKLVNELREKGIGDDAVLAAIEKIPRHFFFDKAFLSHAYEDKAFPIAAEQTISQPYTVAFQTSLLELKKGEKVLEIGTGSGYQTSILHEMGAKVFSIERQKVLYDKAKEFLPKIGVSAKLFYGDGYKGLPTYAPFDKILVTAGATNVPEELINQLKPGGILIIPVGTAVQIMTRIERKINNETNVTQHGNFRFVPLLVNKEWT
ncbi:MAG: protein-L-isoaspartate(D-aspartate) O-methyltransferase [Bacteroidia bacterium]